MKNERVWSINENFPVWSGALVTAGDVVFYGTMDGWFKAVDARTGSVLWQFKCGSGIIGQPVSYRAPDGKQYVAILAGVGGWSGAIVAAAGFTSLQKRAAPLPLSTRKVLKWAKTFLVGARPREAVFTSDNARAYVTAENVDLCE